MDKSLIFTYGLTFGGALASLYRPYVGFLVYVCFGIIKPDALWSWSVPQGNYSRIVAGALLIGWLMHGFGDWRFGRARGVVLAMIGYWATIVLGAVAAPVPELGWATVEPMTKTFLPILVGLTLIDNLDKVRQLAWVIVLSQGFLAYEFNLLYYTRAPFLPLEFFHGSLDNNGIAITMVTSIGLSFFLGLSAARWWQKGLVFGCALLMAHVVLFSHSRGGMVALIVTGTVCFLLVPKRPSSFLLFALAALAVWRLAGEGVQERFMTIFQSSEEAGAAGGKRLAHWFACLDSLLRSPLGVGPNHWPLVAPNYGLPRMAAHSTWLQTAAELGFPGLLFLSSIYALCLGRLLPLTRERRPVADPAYRHFARMVIASLAGFIVAAQFVTSEGVELPYYVVLIGAGVLKLSSSARAARPPRPSVSRVPGSLEPGR